MLVYVGKIRGLQREHHGTDEKSDKECGIYGNSAAACGIPSALRRHSASYEY